MTDFYFAGGETPDHRKRLVEAGVTNISMSYYNLRPRLAKTKRYLIKDHFPPNVSILLDAGAQGAAKKNDWGEDDWRLFNDEYLEFVNDNIDSVEMVTEFDSPSLGRDFIEEMRADYWDEIEPSKFMPVWHEAHGGLPELEQMAQDYERVAITNAVLDERRVMANRLNSLVQKYNLSLHGLGITKPDEITQVRFSSVSSTSWTSPMRYGDTIFWDGSRLRRYPVKYKDQARKRHRMHFAKAGFDPDLIAKDDPGEVTRLSIWSWLQLEQAINRRTGRALAVVADEDPEDEDGEPIVATWADEDETPNVEDTPAPVATTPPVMRNSLPVRPATLPTIPSLNFVPATTQDDKGEQGESVLVAKTSAQSMRKCDNCYVAANCPLYEAGSTCKFGIPVEIRTKEQLMSSMQAIAEMQMQRVAFARFAEDLEGGYPDQNVSGEMDRYMNILKTMKDINDNSSFLKIQVETRGNAGVLSQLFGRQNTPPPAHGIDTQKAEEVIADVLDAEIIEGE